MYGEDDGGFMRRETDNFMARGRTGIKHGWTVNNMLRGDEEPGHFPEDVDGDEEPEPYQLGMGMED